MADIVLFCAHRWEAEPFLKLLDLDRGPEMPVPGFLDQSERWAVYVTGQGALRAAAATASVLATLPPDPARIVANFGTAGASSGGPPIGRAVLINRVRDIAAGTSYYPDRLVRWRWSEAGCLTLHRPGVIGGEMINTVYDMELAGVATAAGLFTDSSQLAFGKLVSDHLADEPPDWKEMIEAVAEPYRAACGEFIELLLLQRALLADGERAEAVGLADLRVAEAEVLLEGRFTVTQSRQLKTALRGASLSGDDEQWQRVLEKLRSLPAVTAKQERSSLFEQLLSSLQGSGLFSKKERL